MNLGRETTLYISQSTYRSNPLLKIPSLFGKLLSDMDSLYLRSSFLNDEIWI